MRLYQRSNKWYTNILTTKQSFGHIWFKSTWVLSNRWPFWCGSKHIPKPTLLCIYDVTLKIEEVIFEIRLYFTSIWCHRQLVLPWDNIPSHSTLLCCWSTKAWVYGSTELLIGRLLQNLQLQCHHILWWKQYWLREFKEPHKVVVFSQKCPW